ncbi:response regulator transcription factor [Amycolatopsis sp. EV170708-02-1]|uniref:helix-turn-helix transcriptional regulator n=1 Tax=Amycolatopsis sp. EV170708-02-1 TaxID=2919322 RepID=UPI001F0B8C1B|nr:response regulator transcription factor [Amycolatopsis sp. EV170708-02-1]UMP06927.1 response regulator transcription factor [Amycolatopsis sp. EV170708-02-1]
MKSRCRYSKEEQLEEVLMRRVRLAVRGPDHLTVIGLKTFLATQQDCTLLFEGDEHEAEVVIIALDRFSSSSVGLLRQTAAELAKPILLIVEEVKDVDLIVAVECQVTAILPRAASADDRLMQCIRSTADGGAHIPPDLLGQLFKQTELVRQELIAGGLNRGGLEVREIAVLRLMADGLDTAEIATELKYSERTVKNILYAVTNRFQLRNRPQAVAYAMRAGVI